MARPQARSARTIDHDEIRDWVEARGGRPSVVADTWNGGSGVLRIDFGEKEESLEEIPWDDFFRIFEERNLAFLYQEETADGRRSRFFKFVERDADEAKEAKAEGEDAEDDTEEEEEQKSQ